MIYLYYRKSIDKMILVNTEPDKDWSKIGRDHTCELYLEDPPIFDRPLITLLRKGPEQDLVAYALRIDPDDNLKS